jgi:hypothetical protein
MKKILILIFATTLLVTTTIKSPAIRLPRAIPAITHSFTTAVAVYPT